MNKLNSNQIKFIGSLYGQHSRWGIYDLAYISPAITASAGLGGGHVTMIIEKVKEDKNGRIIK